MPILFKVSKKRKNGFKDKIIMGFMSPGDVVFGVAVFTLNLKTELSNA